MNVRRGKLAHILLPIVLTAIGMMTSVPTLHAQEISWTAEELEVWNRVEEYSEASRTRNLEAYLGYFHPDFAGWLNGTDTTSDKATRAEMLSWYFANTTPESMEIEPVAIRVFGTCAVVHYKISEVLRMKDGSKQPGLEYWTDVLVKRNGEWLLVADHGGGSAEE